MLAETEALPLGFVAVVEPTDLHHDGPELVACRAASVVGDGWTFAVPVPRATLRPVCYERAVGLLERWAATGADVATAGAGYPVPCA